VYDPVGVSPAVQKRIIECPYVSVEELNRHLVKYRPVALLELTIWAETYSYTLSLSMLTQLPLMVLHKTLACTVMNRLETGYAGKYFMFSTFNELSQLLKEHAQSYFYTISPVLRFSDELAVWFGADLPRLKDLCGVDTSESASASARSITDADDSRNMKETEKENENADDHANDSVRGSGRVAVEPSPPYVLLLTTTVNVSPAIECLYQTNPAERAETYCKTIRRWMHETDVRVVVVENSGYVFSELAYLCEMYPSRLAIVSYNEAETKGAEYLNGNLSKGASELFSIQYAYRQWECFREQTILFVVKLTCRYVVPELPAWLDAQSIPLKQYGAMVQHDADRCELVGANIKYFNTVFNIEMIQPSTGKVIRHVETIYKERCQRIPNVLVCPEFAIEATQRGGINAKYTNI